MDFYQIAASLNFVCISETDFLKIIDHARVNQPDTEPEVVLTSSVER